MRKILIADDEPDLELIITQKFRKEIKSGAFHFEFAGNGAQALQKITDDPELELVFTDINMPVMDGLTLLAKIKEISPVTKSVVVSAYGDVKNIRTAMNRGAFDFITKPIDLEDLEKTLLKALEEIEILKQGIEAGNKLKQALEEKAKAQEEALFNLMEKEKLILKQNEMLETQVRERTVEIRQQKELIEEKNREILDSIHYAKRLQEAILPARSLLDQLFTHNLLIYYPKDIVAGDFYWFSQKNSKVVVAADCTGHGVSGALMSMLGMSLLNQIVNVENITRPDLILNRLHQDVVIALNQQENDSREGMDIVVCSFEDNDSVMYFAGANRPCWIIREGKLIVLSGDKRSVGGYSNEYREDFSLVRETLQPADRLFLFTDGYADQFGGELGKKFMTRRLKDLVTESSSVPLPDQRSALVRTFHHWKGDQEQLDDVLILGLQLP